MMSANDWNIVRLLKDAASKHPKRTALAMMSGGGKKQQLTFAELWARIEKISSGLEAAELAPGDRAVLMVPMSIELYLLLLSVLKTGAVVVFIDPWMKMKQIAEVAAFSEPKAFIGMPKSHFLRLFHRGLGGISLSITTGTRILRIPAKMSLSELEGACGNTSIFPRTAAQSALITFTSGSSGTPKGANRTHGFLRAQHQALRQEFPYETEDVDMPMFPIFALNNLAQGIPSVIPRMDFKNVLGVQGEIIVKQMLENQVSTCTASPPFVDQICNFLEASGRRAPKLRRLLAGGAPVSNAQLERWLKFFPSTEITVVYGSTEAEPVAHISAKNRLLHGSGEGSGLGYCVGKPTPLLETRLLPICIEKTFEGQNAWANSFSKPLEIGELIVSGDHVCKDYYKNDIAVSENKLRDDQGRTWHRMGDTGYFDEAGSFWIVGRVHSTIKRGGKYVHPQLVEQAAAASDPQIGRVAAVGLADQELGERVVLIIEGPPSQHIRDVVSKSLEKAGQHVDEIRFSVKPLPLDPRHNAKIDYLRLKESLQD